jgi:predicted tellurium resistance membrane protein TerC
LDKKERLRAIRFVIIELLVYGGLVTLYALSVLQFLADPLADLYENNMTLYAWLALVLIVGQGVLLEELTSFLLDRLRLTRFE